MARGTNRPIDAPLLADAQSQPVTRLLSLDALRGFDMFWIIGGEELIRSLANLTGNPTFRELAHRHTEHPEWHGFSLYDCIFPLFMFIAGVAIPYSFASHLARGQGSAALHFRVIRRAVLLILLGLVINGALRFNFTLHFDQDASGARQLIADFSNIRFPSVLGRIGLGYMFAALIVLHTRPRNQLLTAIGLLLGYWAALTFVPVPGFQAGALFPGQTLGDYIDRHLLPGHLYRVIRDPEGLFSTIPSIATVLIGVMAGHWLRRGGFTDQSKAAGLAVAGVVCIAAALAWDPFFPINKNLWTSSFVLMTSGVSLVLLSIFYLVIDVWKIRAWAFFFVVIGVNAITVYVGQAVIDFDGLAHLVFSQRMHSILRESGGLMLKWLVLFFLYRQRIFPASLTVSDPVPTQNSAFELLKSLLVIPVVVAVVMGLGYGLARVGERKQAAAGQPDFQVTQVAPDGSIHLRFQVTRIGGQLGYRSGRHPTLANWRHTEDSAAWHFPVEKAGLYAVELKYACDSDNAGSTVRIDVAEANFTLQIADTGGSGTFKTVRAGEANLSTTGWYTLRIVPTKVAHDTVMTLRDVSLVPIKP